VAKRAILIDGATRESVRDAFAFEALGPVTLPGKTQAVEVFAL
jgi:class 3 adenylate cyclase